MICPNRYFDVTTLLLYKTHDLRTYIWQAYIEFIGDTNCKPIAIEREALRIIIGIR